MRRNVLLLIGLILMSSCSNKIAIPKPYAYYRIDLPTQKYKITDDKYPFSFEYHKEAFIEKDKAYDAGKYWINIVYPALNAKIHLSYKELNNNFQTYNEDSHKLAYKHAIKAEAINESEYKNKKNNIYALIYNIKGNTASSVQFFVTDSTKNFLRGSLYFNCIPNKDSLTPMIDYIHYDIEHIIESFKWKDKN
ncbi:MAG: gliding motility lipoprotein GldD [Marinifilaceae bacterium]